MSRHAKKLKRRAAHAKHWANLDFEMRKERTMALARRMKEAFVSPDMVDHEIVAQLRSEGVEINIERMLPTRTIAAFDWGKFAPPMTVFDYLPALPRFEPGDIAKIGQIDHLFRWPEFRFKPV